MAVFTNDNPMAVTGLKYNLKYSIPKIDSTQKWYAGKIPTQKEMYGRILQVYRDDADQGRQMFNEYKSLQTNPASKYYRDYAQPTNRATDYLSSYGFNTDYLGNGWLDTAEADTYIRTNLIYDGATNTPKTPGKKATQDQNIAYWLYQYKASEDKTKKAEEEYQAAIKEAQYYANWADMNYSDDEIVGKVKENFATKYPTLYEMQNNAALGKPTELNRAVDFSDDALYGAVWEARNPGYEGDIEGAMAYSQLGMGKTYQEDPKTTARLTQGSPDYAPYYVGATMNKELSYFGIYSADQAWVDENFDRIMAGNDEKAKEYARSIADGVTYTAKLNGEREAMQQQIDYYISKGFTNADFIVNTIREDTDAYGDLFELDTTMEKGRKYGILKPTTGKVAYRWQDVENEIRARCQEENDREDVVGLAEKGNTSGTKPSDKPTPAYAASGEDEADAVSGAAYRQPFTETEKADEILYKNDLDAVSPVIDANGTEAEKTAFLAGDTLYFERAREQVETLLTNPDALDASVKDRFRFEYPETARTIYDYQSHETNRDALKEKQTKIDTELGELREKAEHFKSFTDMTPEEYENFQAFVASVNDESFDPHWVEILERGDSYFPDEYQKELWEQALGVVYNRIRPTDYGADPDIISAKGKEWWNLYKKMQGGDSPIDELEEKTNKTGDDVDEVSTDIKLPKTNGYFEDDEDSALTVSFEKDDSGNFVFSGAVGNVTGKNYTREEADELLGYQKFDIENGMTAEEQQRLEILERSSAELAQKIKDEEGWLSANKELYDEAVMDKDTLLTAAQYNGDAELANTFDNVFGFTQSTPYADYQYMPYSFYDYYAENEVMTKEQAYASAAEGVLTTSEQLKGIDDALATLSEAGIELSEDEMKMLQKNKSDLEHINKSLAYSALNANAGFDEAAEAGKEMAESGKYGQLAKSVASGKWELEAWDYVFGFLGGAGSSDSILRDMGKKENLLLSMSEDEKNRFFYLLKTDGEKAAEDYFKFIADPTNGELTIRTSGDVAKRTEEFASQNWFNALLSTAASFVGKRMGNAEATANRIGSLITGEEMSSYNPAFWMSDATKGMRQGAKDWLQDEFGKNDISDKLYDVITGVVDIAIASKEMSALGSIFEGTKIGNAVLKAGQWLNNSSAGGVVASFVKDAASVLPVSIEAWNSTYQRVFDATKDADTANQMAAVAFAADIVSHAVIMKGMRKSFETDPSAFSSKLSSYFYQVFTNAGAAGTSTLITEKFTDDCERIIMEDMSTYGQLVQKYKDMDYPDSMAEHYAELEMWGMIVNHVEESVENSVIRTTVTFAANEVKNSKTYQKAKDQLQVLKEYFKPTKTEEGFIRAGEWANAPEGFHDAVPDDAIVNPIDKNGTVMYDRTTGKPHTVVAFMVTDSGDLVYIDSNGEQVPFFNIAMQGGSIAGNWTDDEYNLLSIGWNYYKDQYMPDTTGTRETVNAETPGKEPGTDIVPTGNGTANTPGLPSGTGYLPGATNNEQTVKDLSVLSNSYGSKPAATAVGLSVVLKNPDPNASKAAGQNLVSLAGDPKAAIAVTQQMIVNAPNPAETKEDIVAAALVDGSGREAMNTIIEKVTTGQKITAIDIDALHNGVEEDKAADPEGFKEAAEAAVKESRIANGTIRILALPAHKNRIMAAEADAAAKKRDADNANQYMTQKQNEAQAAAENLLSAEANYNPQEDTQTGGPLQQQTEKLMGADTAATQAEDAYKQQQQIAEEAQKKNEEIRNEEIASARQEATVQVEQEMADEQAVRDQQVQAAAEAEQQRNALMQQEAEAEAAKQTERLNKARTILSGKGLTGERLERNAIRMAELMEQKERGEFDLDQTLREMEDLKDAFLRKMSNKIGVTIESEDLGDPLKIQAMIVDGNRVILNQNIKTAQALIIAADHEFQHGLEVTGAYDVYAREAIKYMYGGEDTEAYRNALNAKKAEYASLGHSLGSDDAARRELIATFTQNNMSDISFIRKMVSLGEGSRIKEALRTSLDTLKGYKFKGAAKRKVNQLQKLRRMYQEQIDEKARMVKEGYNGHTGITQFSITSASQAAGLTVEVTDDENYRYKLYDADGNELAPGSFTPEMVIGTPVGKVIDLPAEIVRDELNQKVKDGLMTQEESDAEYNKRLPALQKAAEDQRKFISDIINMIGQYQDAAMVWELAGSLSFSTLKTNGDPQYSDSFDMGTICTKTQAILNVISETQVRLGRGLTKKEIDNIVYNEVGKGVQDENGNWKHGATPCPPCYVYATWVNKPARLEMIRQYQNKFKDWTSEQINEFMNAQAPSSKKAATERNRQKLWISTCLADEHKDPVTGESTWTRKENPSICPDEILLDLRRSGDMAALYPGTWKFMQKGGNAQGKAIAPYSDARLGESIIGKAIGAGELNARLLADAQNAGNPDYIPQFVNPFLTGDDEKAKEYFAKAIAKIKAQNLEGGQRWQSWSDGRAEWGSDYLMEMLTMQALGAKVQTYTKVPEMLPLLASAGFEVNMSLMPEGDGFAHNEDGSIKIDEDGNPVLAFSKVTGIDPEAAEAFAKQYGEKGNVQPMVVGISDEHIKAALAGDYITFVIPFHGSGGSVKRLQHLMSLLHEKMNSGNDYTKAQTDKFISGEVNTNPNWALREAIITGNYYSLTDKQKEDIEKNDFLRKLYEDRYLNEDSPAYQVFFTKGQAQQIFPYEYWDTSTTLANADENSRRFIDYCNLLGVIPRFSGLQKKNGTEYANFSGAKRDDNGNIIGYDPVPGYWKLLIDRPMYRRIYDENGKLIKDQCTYRDPEVVNVGNIEVTAMPMAANNTVGHSDDETRQITDRVIQQILLNKGPATSAYAGNMTLGNTPSEQTENKAIIKNAMYADSDVQLSAGGDLTDAEMLSLIDEVGKAVEDLTTDDILNMFGMTSLEGQNTDPQELITETVQEIEDEFDPTIYNGRLYVKPETLDFWLSDEGFAADDPNYAQAYITTMDPNDFLRITTASEAGREIIRSEAKPLDEEKLAEYAKVQPIELFINEETGEITGHQGRHRSLALARAGVTEVPVLLFDRRTNTSKTPKDSLTLKGQDTKRRHMSNIKNEETITFDDVIPLSNAYRDELYERFTASDEERMAAGENDQRILQYSAGGDVADSELLQMLRDHYAEAAASGDMEAAQKDLDLYAEQKGYTIKAYHGSDTDERFTVFKPGLRGEMWFASTENTAYDRKNMYDTYLKMKNPVEFTYYIGSNSKFDPTYVTEEGRHNGHDGGIVHFKLDPELVGKSLPIISDFGKSLPATDKFGDNFTFMPHGKDRENLAKPGETMVEFMERGARETLYDWYVVYNPKQIKSADPVTYDDDGNPIPLEERFTDSPDIRNSLGGDIPDAELLSIMADNGLISPEMIPYSYVPSTNVQSAEGTKYRQFGRKTAQESDALHEQVKDYLYKNSLYVPDTNAEQVNRALAWVKSHATESDPDGYYASLREVMDPNFNFRTADGQARMLSVMGMAAIKADQGDERALQDEIDLADAYNKQGTDLAQALQARKLFRMMTPVGRKAVLQREADRINQNLADLGKKYRVSIPDELLEEAANAKSEKDFENSRNKIRQVLNEQIPVTWGERIIGWRMLSMLSAPKTHIRNIGGNLMFVPVVGTKNKVAAIIEAGAQKFGKLDKDERTKTIGLANPAARKFASSRTNDIEDVLRGNAKYGEGDKRQQERKIFGTKDNVISKTFGKALQWWYDANGKALEWEDWLFLKYHYTRALGGYMTARGLKPEDMKGTVLEDADLYAIQEAHKATYRDDSPVANWMNKIGSKKANADNNKALSVIQWIVNTRFPFKRTPINIAKRGIEYSPVGLGKSLTYDLAHLKQYLDAKNGKLENMPKSAISPTQWIDKFASGLTGTGIMIAGAVAAALGIARAGLDSKDPEDQIAKMAGEQEYSIRPGKLTDLELIDEDVSMTLDWAAPVVLPFFTGVGLKEYFEKNGFSVGGVLDLLMEVTEPMLNMSFMSGVSDLFKNNNYSTKDGFWQFIEKTGINFLTSLIPTWSGQIASTVNGRRTTYSGGESLTGDPDIDRMIQQIGNKIPWLNLGGVPYTNDLGEEQEPVIASWAENLLSPAYFSRVDESSEMQELARLYLTDPQNNKTILPAKPKQTIKINGQDVSLNGEEYTQLKADHGTVWRDTIQSLLNNPLYQMASDDSRAAMFDLADQYATQAAKYMTDSRYKMDTWAESAYINGNAGDVIINKVAAKNKQYYVEGQTKSLAEALMTNNTQDIQKYADELNQSNASPSDVRKELTAYFKPLYKQAYQNNDVTTMADIEFILTNINGYLDLEKPVTKYTKKKDFDKWITSTDTVTDTEDEDQNDWLNP